MRIPLTSSTRHLVATRIWEIRLRRRPRARAALGALRAQQWWSPEKLASLQSRRLQTLIEHAYANVPYYRRVMSERGVRPAHIRSAADLPLLPLLTKDVIRDNLGELRAERGVDRPHLIQANHTGGSTGTPLDFYQDQAYRDWGSMELIRNYEMCGYRLGDPIAFVWGSDYDARTHATVRGRLRNALDNTLYLDAFDSSERDFVNWAKQLAAFRPRLLVGYATSLALLARVVETYGLPSVRPGAIQSSAEVLTEAQRSLLQRTFHCEVFDRYGCREVGNIAHECNAHAGLHVLTDNNALELLHEGRAALPSETADIVVTNLHNRAMPFIRYVNGDLAVATDERCTCGRGLALIRAVVGRSADIIVAPSGKLLHGEFFSHLFYKVPTVKEFQVVQRTPTLLEVNLVPGPEFDQSETLTFLRRVIQQYGDPAFDVQFVLADSIRRSASGKFRFTISEVPVQIGAQGVQ